MKKRLMNIILILVIVVFAFLIVINLPIIQVNHKASDNDYSHWMNDTIESDMNIVDVRMLGAHDAYSSDINIFSKADIYADSISKGILGKILKGFLVKQTVTQIADTEGLLKSGVRYFDIRLTYHDGAWATKHSFMSSDFTGIAEDLVKYLSDSNGEFLVLDFQHIDGLNYDDEDNYLIFLDMLKELGLLDFNYSNNLKALGEITYYDITDDKKTSKVIIIDRFTSDDKQTYHYNKSVRSTWANNDNFKGVVDFLKEESDHINGSSEYNNSFKVMQAVTTMQLSLSGIGNSIKTWSLVERASDFNNYLINNDDFETILKSLPIVMVDYSNTNEDGFLDNVMEIIIEANSQ